MGILCIFNGILFLATLILSLLGSLSYNSLKTNENAIIEDLIDRGISPVESHCALIVLQTRAKSFRNWGFIILGVCGINFVAFLLFWINISNI